MPPVGLLTSAAVKTPSAETVPSPSETAHVKLMFCASTSMPDQVAEALSAVDEPPAQRSAVSADFASALWTVMALTSFRTV